MIGIDSHRYVLHIMSLLLILMLSKHFFCVTVINHGSVIDPVWILPTVNTQHCFGFGSYMWHNIHLLVCTSSPLTDKWYPLYHPRYAFLFIPQNDACGCFHSSYYAARKKEGVLRRKKWREKREKNVLLFEEADICNPLIRCIGWEVILSTVAVCMYKSCPRSPVNPLKCSCSSSVIRCIFVAHLASEVHPLLSN